MATTLLLLLGAFSGAVSVDFQTQEWTYNASLFWTEGALIDERNGHAVVQIAGLLTDLVFDVKDLVVVACTPDSQQEGYPSCEEPGWCYLPQVLDNINLLGARASEAMQAVAPKLMPALEAISLSLADKVNNLTKTVPACAAMAEIMEDLCLPCVLEVLRCLKGISELSRLAMSRIHAAQVAASFPGRLRTAQPPVVFEGTRGSQYPQVLASLLRDLSDRKEDSVVTAAEIGVHTGKTSSFLLEKLPKLEMILVDPFEFADETYFEVYTLHLSSTLVLPAGSTCS